MVQHSPTYERLRPEITKLDRFYIPTRYPNGLPIDSDPATAFDHDDAVAAIATAGRAVDHAREFLDALASDTDHDRAEGADDT